MIGGKHKELLNTRCDVVVCSRSATLAPSLCWGVAGHVHANGEQVTVWLARDRAETVLADITATGRIAAVFSQPYSNVSLQIKGRDAVVRDARAEDSPLLVAHLDNMIREIALVGFTEPLVRSVFDVPVDKLAAIDFTAHSFFEQTPGPRAGHLIASTP